MSKTPNASSASFPESELYSRLGVSAAKADVERAASVVSQGLVPSAFCRISPDAFQRDPRFCTVAHSDGAGSKSILAYLKLRETGRADAFRAIAHDALVMNLDDVLCCGVTSGFSYVSVINRNAERVGPDVLSAIIEGTVEAIERLSKYGVEITFCGGETADVGDVVQTVLVDGALTARFPRSQVVKNQLTAGHVIVALSGHGSAASYEVAHNSGIGSNGITLARRALLSPAVALKYPEIASCEAGNEDAYFGTFLPSDLLPGSDLTIIDALLSPTRTFAPIIHAFLEIYRSQVSGIVHNTGGGHVKSLKAARDVHVHKKIPWPAPPIFTAIQRRTDLSEIEMAKIFNLGWRMEVYCEEQAAEALIKLAAERGVIAKIVGHVVPGKPGCRQLTISVGDASAIFES